MKVMVLADRHTSCDYSQLEGFTGTEKYPCFILLCAAPIIWEENVGFPLGVSREASVSSSAGVAPLLFAARLYVEIACRARVRVCT